MRPFLVAAAAAATMAPHSGFAMPHCGDRESVAATLSDNYEEQHFASGLQSETGLLEIWASDELGTWTVLLTRPDGQTCVMASGTHWLVQKKSLMPTGDPA